ncbi:MAG: hypothetical protein A2X82_15810 [Geobacteraceae bacterium GWC2_55_20]|nr:MAG: hypothetical protein A2X82_15810 [Geobacteraceae bacterium GWC2_55_20]OGU20349.1 MAG: hypothetical protein A2X85_09935 [Geobacteraceae bacterium GWF2_54_21]HBA72883.1 hypothetical protein [Geobacter sp.]HCE67647.1 hypothetical protein [Geobacter sp.]
MTKDTLASEKKLDSGASSGEQPKQVVNKSFIVAQWRLIIILLLVIAVAGMYVWKNVAVNRATVQLTEKAGRIITDQNRKFLRLAVVPLVWAVRSEMIRENYDQINLYLNQFVKEQNMKEIVVAKPDGAIVVSTNKKFEGKPVTDIFPASVLQEDKLMVSTLENGDIMVASPVMGLSTKVGVLILLYTPESYNLQAP